MLASILAMIVPMVPGGPTAAEASPGSSGWFTVNPDIDICIESHHPDVNYGSVYEFYVSGSGVAFERYIYLRFNLSGHLPAGAEVLDVHLNLYKSYDTSGVAGPCRLMAADPDSPNWNESSLTWNLQPGIDPDYNRSAYIDGRIQEFYCDTRTDLWQNVSSPALVDITQSFLQSGLCAYYYISSNFTGVGSKGWLSDEGSHRPYLAVRCSPAPSLQGLLRVTTNPAVPSMIYIDGNWASRWGLDWVAMPVGQHTLSFGDVPGFGAPADVTVTVFEAQVTTYEARFTQYGSLRVMTSPAVPSTIYVDGIPRNTWGLWVDVPAGVYEVEFGPVPGFLTPSLREIVVTSGEYCPTMGEFTLIR